MADSAIERLIGSSSAFADQLGSLGSKAEAARRSWESLVGPGVQAPEPAPTPAPSPNSFVPTAPALSLPGVVAGAAAFGLLLYLVIRGR